jgi:hypothetical protein
MKARSGELVDIDASERRVGHFGFRAAVNPIRSAAEGLCCGQEFQMPVTDIDEQITRLKDYLNTSKNKRTQSEVYELTAREIATE